MDLVSAWVYGRQGNINLSHPGLDDKREIAKRCCQGFLEKRVEAFSLRSEESIDVLGCPRGGMQRPLKVCAAFEPDHWQTIRVRLALQSGQKDTRCDGPGGYLLWFSGIHIAYACQ
ncbi:hypothetical protein ACFRJ9_22605 [Paenarthrobacter sp. NPDC056912]|uniref:hypothetical protein n=1 Tax=Paenarthrobacter sp. NPDC056912 TaxID=3345965 RepID=UPI00366FDD7D